MNISRIAPVLMSFFVMSIIDLVGISVDRVQEDMQLSNTLALYKSRQLGDHMFHYNQVGVPGLWLEWKRNWVVTFYGGEIFYHLGYINEAYRWAFEAMVTKASPHLLKRLVMHGVLMFQVALL